MARPEVAETAELVYAELGPYTVGDEDQGWHLLRFVDAICEVLFETIHQLVSDRDDLPGWAILLDPDLCPAPALPYLAQYAGVQLEPSLTEAQQREKIRLPENFKRGTLAAMEQAVKRTLTGTQTVLIEERHDDSAYKLWVRTFAFETPDPDATEAAVLSQKPAGIVLTYEAVTGQTWSDLVADHADWDAVVSDYADWNEAVAELP